MSLQIKISLISDLKNKYLCLCQHILQHVLLFCSSLQYVLLFLSCFAVSVQMSVSQGIKVRAAL